LAAGDARERQDVLAAFWAEVRERGTPLVEPVANDPQAALVTFLWRGTPKQPNVLIFGGPGGRHLDRVQMARLGESDVWHKTYRARHDLCTTYLLSPDDPLTPLTGDVDWAARMATWRPDPLNPRAFSIPRDEEDPDDREWTTSVIELPGVPPQPWRERRTDVPAGEVTPHRLSSERLDNERRVWVYTPPGYTAEGGPYGLLVVFDGLVYLDVVPTPVILDNLLAERRLPPMVAVLVDSLGARRNVELPCYPPFAAFLAEELLPWVRARYAVSDDPARAVVAGSSHGGLAAVNVALEHPEVFGHVLSQSGWFLWRPDPATEPGALIRRYAEQARLPLRFWLDIGLLEDHLAEESATSPLAANRHLRDVLRAKGYPVAYAEYASGYDYRNWRGTLADGLLVLLS
jgi:enterochelin esterase family protein